MNFLTEERIELGNLPYQQVITVIHAWCISNPGRSTKVSLSSQKWDVPAFNVAITATPYGFLRFDSRGAIDYVLDQIADKWFNGERRDARYSITVEVN